MMQKEDSVELVGISNDKKTFVRALAKIFTLLLNKNVDTINKIKKHSQNSYRNNIENVARTKTTVRRLPQVVIPQRCNSTIP